MSVAHWCLFYTGGHAMLKVKMMYEDIGAGDGCVFSIFVIVSKGLYVDKVNICNCSN